MGSKDRQDEDYGPQNLSWRKEKGQVYEGYNFLQQQNTKQVQQNQTNAHSNPHQLLKQRTKSLDASAVAEVFLKTQFGSPTSTGHALFGVLPQNSPIRAQLNEALRLQHNHQVVSQQTSTFQYSSSGGYQTGHHTPNGTSYNSTNPFITSSTQQGSTSTKSSEKATEIL